MLTGPSDEEVVEAVCQTFSLPSSMPRASSLLRDCALDSLQMIELVSLIEDLAGAPPGEAPEDFPILETLEDCIDYVHEIRQGYGVDTTDGAS